MKTKIIAYEEKSKENDEAFLLSVKGKYYRFPKSLCLIDEVKKFITIPEWYSDALGLEDKPEIEEKEKL